MKQWFVAQTQPGKEMLSQAHLERQCFSSFLPFYRKIIRHARQEKEVLRPLFPGYIFVEIDPERDQWRSINGTRGISALLTQDNKPIPVPSPIIQQLQNEQGDTGAISLESLGLFKVGEKVRLMSGAFEDQVAVISSLSDQDRAKVLLQFMNRTIEVEAPLTILEKED